MHIQAQDLSKIYGQGENQVTALNRASLEIAPGDFISQGGRGEMLNRLSGRVYRANLKKPSRLGENLKLHLLSGLDRPTSGRLTYDGRDICGLTDRELSAFRRVGKDHVRSGDEGPGNGHPLLLSAGELVGQMGQAVLDAQQLRQMVQIRLVRLFPVQQQGHDDIFPGRQNRDGPSGAGQGPGDDYP